LMRLWLAALDDHEYYDSHRHRDEISASGALEI